MFFGKHVLVNVNWNHGADRPWSWNLQVNLEFKSQVVKDAGIFHRAVASGPPSPTDAKVMGWSGDGDIGIGTVTLALFSQGGRPLHVLHFLTLSTISARCPYFGPHTF